MNKIKIVEIIFLILFCHSVFSQGFDFKFKSFSIEDGLSHNVVECMLQDSRGFIWIGTPDGLNKFDGYSFTVYRPGLLNEN
ncbi:two-component regulator propeller domain-containing protein, partial [Seleniivibrio sp.]|uniref:two-component regulator propeller domain-containing protein n=1 Tax=Seleniivibrio sp. TaxID=2898801 RepID=UPI0025EB5636